MKSSAALQHCERCGKNPASRFEAPDFAVPGETRDPVVFWLCRRCARIVRREEPPHSETGAVTRAEFIAAMDEFWSRSGAAEICGRCHEQGTGCCPPMCRYLQKDGCARKNVFCTSFACSALLNAIAECDPQTGRILKWVKSGPGPGEFRIYEMVTRVPAQDREAVRPLILAKSFPSLKGLDGQVIRTKLLALAEEVLRIRRQWHPLEQASVSPGCD